MIVHIIQHGKFARIMIEFFDRYFDDSDNRFIVFGGSGDEGAEDLRRFKNVVEVASSKKVMPYGCQHGFFNDADAIIIHGCFYWDMLFPIIALYRRKTALVFWGGDIRNLETGGNFAKRIAKCIALKMIPTVKAIATLMKCDRRALSVACRSSLSEKWYQVSVIDPSKLENTYADIVAEASAYRGDGVVRVVVGNSATRTNRHEDALRKLAEVFDGYTGDYEIYVPLAYGDAAYADEVVEIGYSLFGNKLKPVREFVSPDEYRRFLAKMDVGVFDLDRQQGMGNINTLLRVGSKVYLADDCPMRAEYAERGVTLYPMSSMRRSDVKGFVVQPTETMADNMTATEYACSPESSRNKWAALIGFMASETE